MADIYLAISETPTVVTLTSAVINSAVASSVTVTNTVTVALDANSLSALENVTVTVGAAITGTVTVGNSVTISSLPAISGTVTANNTLVDGSGDVYPALGFSIGNGLATQVVGPDYNGAITVNGLPAVPISGTVTVGNTVTIAGTVTANPTGTQTIAGTVTANVGGVPNDNGIPYFGVGYFNSPGSGLIQVSQDANCGLPINGTVTVGNTVTIAGTVTANTFAIQGTAVTTSNFTSTTASTVLANYNATREVLTIFSEGPGTLFVAPGATCTTIAYQVRLSAGDYYEVPNHQTTITHSAVFATAGTARVTEVS